MKKLIFKTVIMSVMFLTGQMVMAGEHKEKLAIVNIDVQGFDGDVSPGIVQSMMYFEMESLGLFEILDKYDVRDEMKAGGYEPDAVLGLKRQLEVARAINAQLILNGSVELFGNKIVILTKLVDVQSARVRKSHVTEYVNLPEELQRMIRLSLREMMGMENNQKEVEMLIEANQPINSPKTTLVLNGPRMGLSVPMGSEAQILQADKDQGGFEMAPVNVTFGYQHEFQYLSSGQFQALVELVGNVTGMESGKFIPSLAVMNGFRFNDSGIEFALGPVFRPTTRAKGFYDDSGQWHLWSERDPLTEITPEYRLDSRGSFSLTTGLVVAAGKTFTSGYLNFPVNAYVIPRKDGTILGLSLGFNMAK